MTTSAQRTAQIDAITAKMRAKYGPRGPFVDHTLPAGPEPIVDFEGLLNALQGVIDDSRGKHMSAGDLKIFLDSVIERYERMSGAK